MDTNKIPQVIFEDNHILALNKPSGMLAQGDDTENDPIAHWAKQYLKEKYNKPGNVFAGVVHRLDRPTSGLMLLAKTSKALSRLNEMIKNRLIQKSYLALVAHKPPKDNDTLTHHLSRISNKNITRATFLPNADSKKAVLHYELIQHQAPYFLLQIQPETGRQHQIRVQLATIGCPIVGDVKYGFKQPNPDLSICLHAHSLHFIHPVKNEPLQLFANLPENRYWKPFTNAIKNKF